MRTTQFRSRIWLTLKTSNADAADKPVGESTVVSDSVAPWAGDKPEEDGPVDSDYVDRMVRTTIPHRFFGAHLKSAVASSRDHLV